MNQVGDSEVRLAPLDGSERWHDAEVVDLASLLPGAPDVSAPSVEGYSWPLCAPVTSEYGPRWGRMHTGIDLGAPTGTPVGASKDGVVASAQPHGGYGLLVILEHDDGVRTYYAHLTRFAVARGDTVEQGERIGDVGNTGNSTGPHLHFETRVGGTPVDPRTFLSGSPCA